MISEISEIKFKNLKKGAKYEVKMEHKGYLRVKNILLAAGFSFEYTEAYLYGKFQHLYSITQIKEDLQNYFKSIKRG